MCAPVYNIPGFKKQWFPLQRVQRHFRDFTPNNNFPLLRRKRFRTRVWSNQTFLPTKETSGRLFQRVRVPTSPAGARLRQPPFPQKGGPNRARRIPLRKGAQSAPSSRKFFEQPKRPLISPAGYIARVTQFFPRERHPHADSFPNRAPKRHQCPPCVPTKPTFLSPSRKPHQSTHASFQTSFSRARSTLTQFSPLSTFFPEDATSVHPHLPDHTTSGVHTHSTI